MEDFAILAGTNQGILYENSLSNPNNVIVEQALFLENQSKILTSYANFTYVSLAMKFTRSNDQTFIAAARANCRTYNYRLENYSGVHLDDTILELIHYNAIPYTEQIPQRVVTEYNVRIKKIYFAMMLFKSIADLTKVRMFLEVIEAFNDKLDDFIGIRDLPQIKTPKAKVKPEGQRDATPYKKKNSGTPKNVTVRRGDTRTPGETPMRKR